MLNILNEFLQRRPRDNIALTLWIYLQKSTFTLCCFLQKTPLLCVKVNNQPSSRLLQT